MRKRGMDLQRIPQALLGVVGGGGMMRRHGEAITLTRVYYDSKRWKITTVLFPIYARPWSTKGGWRFVKSYERREGMRGPYQFIRASVYERGLEVTA